MSGSDQSGADHVARPLVSVIVPVRDDAPGLARLIERLRDQTLPQRDYEVIVADDGSSPPVEAPPVVGGPSVVVLRAGRGNSYSARNRGAAAARGRVLAFTDADCLPRLDWLAAGVRALESADVVGGHVLPLQPPRPTAWSLVDAMLFDQARFVDMGAAATANLFVSAALFEAQGGFDESLPSGGDWEFEPVAFLMRRWRIERAFAMRRARAGGGLLQFAAQPEPVVPRRWGVVVGYDAQRLRVLGIASGPLTMLRTVLPRYAIIPLVDGLAQCTGWLSVRFGRRMYGR